DDQPRPRVARPGPRHVRQRLARLPARRHPRPVGRGAEGDRPRPQGGREEEALPRQRRQVLRAEGEGLRGERLESRLQPVWDSRPAEAGTPATPPPLAKKTENPCPRPRTNGNYSVGERN